jgi:uncharacterized protein YeaO (DUF488 family)
MIKLKRAYEKPAKADGLRILVDRLWPRGVTKVAAHIDVWLKDVAPSTALRTWFGHDPARWDEFRRRYFEELKQSSDAVARLRALIAEQPVTLVYAAKDTEHTHALALKDFVERKSKRVAAKTKKAAAKRQRAAVKTKKTATKRPRPAHPKAGPRRRS